MNDRDGFRNTEKSKTLSWSTFFEPRFKLIPFSHNSSSLSTIKSDIFECTTEIINVKSTDVNIEPELSFVPDANIHPNIEILSIWDDIDSNVAKYTVLGTAESRAIVEVQHWLEDAINRNQDLL